MPETQILPAAGKQIHSIAAKMKKEGKTLIMIQAYLEKDGTPVVTYDFDFGPVIREYEIRGEKTLPTISDIYDVAAQWPEREIMELMDITFEGVDTSERLFLPNNLIEGTGQILVTPMDELIKKNQPDCGSSSGA